MNSPFTGGKVDRRVKTITVTFRNELFTVRREYYVCVDTGKTFSNAEVDDNVLNDVFSQYRNKYGIPSPEDLRNLRIRLGLSAHIMSKIASIGINQYGLYENGELPTKVIGQKLAELFDSSKLLRFIDLAADKLGNHYLTVRKTVERNSNYQSYSLVKNIYGKFSEAVPVNKRRIVYAIKKPRWVTYRID